MSESTRYHAQKTAAAATTEGLQVLIAELEESPAWKGCEFDDARVRHKAATRLEVYRVELAIRIELPEMTNRELAQAADDARHLGRTTRSAAIAAEMDRRNKLIGRVVE